MKTLCRHAAIANKNHALVICLVLLRSKRKYIKRPRGYNATPVINVRLTSPSLQLAISRILLPLFYIEAAVRKWRIFLGISIDRWRSDPRGVSGE